MDRETIQDNISVMYDRLDQLEALLSEMDTILNVHTILRIQIIVQQIRQELSLIDER
jgi:hypothetical protein